LQIACETIAKPDATIAKPGATKSKPGATKSKSSATKSKYRFLPRIRSFQGLAADSGPRRLEFLSQRSPGMIEKRRKPWPRFRPPLAAISGGREQNSFHFRKREEIV
jgi:hypothetical protein